MTIFAGDAPVLDRRTMLDIPADAGEVFGAAFDSAFSTNPTTSLVRSEELAQQADGRAVVMGPESYLAPNAGRLEPETPLLNAQSARDRVAGMGLDIKIPDQGIRQGALDVLVDRHREQAARQQVLARANGGAMGTQIAASLAASLLDPLNVASAFVPVVGEARFAAMLGRASGPLGRAGVRAGVGAVEGSVGAALIEPLPLLAASQDQTEYGLSDSLANIALGGILGGGLHTFGGAIGDALRKNTASAPAAEAPDHSAFRSAEQQMAANFNAPQMLGRTEITPPDDMMRIQNAHDFASRVNRRAEFDDSGRPTYADGTAYGQEDILPFYRAHVEGKDKGSRAPDALFQIGRVDDESARKLASYIKGFEGGATEARISGSGIAHIRDSRPGIAEEMLGRLSQSVLIPDEVLPNPKNPNRALMVLRGAPTGGEKQKIGVTVLEVAATDGQGLNVITSMTTRENGAILKNARELARAEGLHSPHLESATESPHAAAVDFPTVAREAGLRESQTARAKASAAPWYIRRDALRTAVAQAVSGRDVEVQSLFDLTNPAKAAGALEQIKRPTARRVDPQGQAESLRADSEAKTQGQDDFESAKQAYEDDEALVNEMLAQLPEADRSAIVAAGREEAQSAQAQADRAEQYSKAYRAAAVCDIRNGQ